MLTPESNKLRIDLKAPIRGKADLPELPNLDNVNFIEIWFTDSVIFNSCGIRDWLLWIKPLAKDSIHIEVHECPYLVIQLFNMITDFLPANSVVISFYVLYYSDETEESKKILFRRGHEVLEDRVVLPKVLDSTGEPMVIDIDERKFFNFLGLPISKF